MSLPRPHPVPRDDPSPPRLRTLQSPDHRPPRPILRHIVVTLLPHPPSFISSPWSSVDCCFDPQTRLMLPPMVSLLMSAAAVVFRQYRPMPLSSYNAPLSAVDTDRCRLCQAAVAFVVPLPSPAVIVQRCPCCMMLPSSYDAAVVVQRCRRRTALPSSYDAAVVVQRYYRMPLSAAVVGCCGQGCLWRRCFARELHRVGRKVRGGALVSAVT